MTTCAEVVFAACDECEDGYLFHESALAAVDPALPDMDVDDVRRAVALLRRADELVADWQKRGDQANADAVNSVSDAAEEYFGGKAVAFYHAADTLRSIGRNQA